MPALRNFGMALALTCAVCLAQAAAPESKVLKVGTTSISLAWDSAWQVGQTGSGAPPNTAQFQLANPHDMLVLLSAEAKPSADADVEAYMKLVIGKAIGEYQSVAVEKKLEPRMYSNGAMRGQVVCATDRAPKPEEYKYVCQGISTNGDVALIYTVLYNDPGKAQAEKATKALEGAQITQGA
jgi:hypothetical protein